LQIIVLRVESGRRGIVRIGFRGGAGFIVSRAQACGSGNGVYGGLHADDVQAHFEVRDLFQL